jgi:uncharacterized lipoprotein
MKKILIAAVAILVLSGCGYEGHYRYECQDPKNWDNDKCHPPVCLVDGMCTETLLGFDPREQQEIPQEDQP